MIARNLLVAALFTAVSVQGATLDEMETMLRAGKYALALPSLLQVWSGGDHSQRVEYMIARSLCGSGQSEKGRVVIADLLLTQHLTDTARAKVEAVAAVCGKPASARPAGDDASGFSLQEATSQATSGRSSGAGVIGETKGGFMLAAHPEPDSAVTRVTPIPATDLRARRLPRSDAALALRQALERTGSSGGGASMGGFVVALPFVGGPAGRVEAQARRIGECLQRYETALVREFRLHPLDDVITVYAVGDVDQVATLSQKVHGLDFPIGAVAYSVAEDESIVGVGDGRACGSLAHEVAHLLIRRNFGIAPPWLEEGIASEVAIARPLDDRFEFGRSWRDDTLASEWTLRPRLPDLLQRDWRSYRAASDAELHRVAAVHAMAAVFVRYLAQRGKLDEAFFALRDQRFTEDFSRRRTDAEIVASVVGSPVEELDAHFAGWFKGPDPQPAAKQDSAQR
jgi:hypothetical protein